MALGWDQSLPGGSKFLFVVERDFLSAHVGVRRVILHYWRALQLELGVSVTFACPNGRGQLLRGEHEQDESPPPRALRQAPRPDWSSDRPWLQEDMHPSVERMDVGVRWTEELVEADNYLGALITNPWLCAEHLPPLPRATMVVYDMVPHLLAIGALHFPVFVDAFEFAHAHDAGYRYAVSNKTRILCISEATRKDFLRFYPQAHPRTLVDLPFSQRSVDSGPRRDSKSQRVLLVNALDPRKNIDGIVKAIASLAKDQKMSLAVVGRERMSISQTIDRLKSITDMGVDVEWYRNASDEVLQWLYGLSDVLLFPSYYEGLGLPILEAQAAGLAVVSSDTSSCVEVNLNPMLCAPPTDPLAIASKLRLALSGDMQLLRGNDLRAELATFLESKSIGAGALGVGPMSVATHAR